MKLSITDREGQHLEIETEPGARLMEILRDHGLVEALCGGFISCGTCHVYMESTSYSRLPLPDIDENTLLEGLSNYEAGRSRLTCQINLTEEAGDLDMQIAPQD